MQVLGYPSFGRTGKRTCPHDGGERKTNHFVKCVAGMTRRLGNERAIFTVNRPT